MNINVTNLDQGYTQCEELNTLVKTSGESIISSLGTDIQNLKAHWVGSDATTHINNLIKVYNALVGIVTDAKKITAAAGNAIIQIQEIRRSNGGSGQVGNPLSNTAPDSITIQDCGETTEYRCDPTAKADYTQLVQIVSDFETLKNKFQVQKDTLLTNWTAGANREGAVKCFDDFMTNAETYKIYLTSAKDNLEIAVNNLSQL